MDSQIKREIRSLKPEQIQQIKREYLKGTGLTCWDIARKYRVSFSTICYLVKS